MPLSQSSSEPLRTKQLLLKLNLAIDKARLVKKIMALNDELRVIENMPDKSTKAQYLRAELKALEDRLTLIREQTS